MGYSVGTGRLERVERQAPPPHPSPLKGEGVGGGVGLAAADPRREAADWVRLHLPVCSEFAAELRKVFGSGVRMTHASEAGHVLGKAFETPAFSVSGDALLPFAKEKQK